MKPDGQAPKGRWGGEGLKVTGKTEVVGTSWGGGE